MAAAAYGWMVWERVEMPSYREMWHWWIKKVKLMNLREKNR